VIRVLLIDDHASFRQPLAFMLEREPDITVVGQAGTLAEARGLLHGADIAVIDLALPDGNGMQLIKELHGASPQSQALVLTGRGAPVEFARAVEAGAAGVLQKSVGISDIIDAVRRLHAGESLLSPQETIALLRLAARQREHDREALAAARRLTPREREVLQGLAAGLGDKEIAQRLYISTETARTHMVNILAKLGVETRLQALVFAVRHGLVTIE
jgi:DNA-binding NarL/FixJ family response regulator